MLTTSRRRMPSRPVAALAGLTLAVVALCSCTATVGGRGQRAVSDFPSTSTASPSPSASGSGAAADDLVRRAKNVLLLGGPVALDGHSKQDDTTIRVTGSYSFDGCSVVVAVGYLRLQVREISNVTYVQAPAVYWEHSDVAAAHSVTSDQWVAVEDDTAFPAYYGSTMFLEGMVLPGSDLDVDVTGTTTSGGRSATVLTDEEGWSYAIVDDPATPRVVHVGDGEGSEYDVTYPTGGESVTAPPANLVVKIPGI